MDSLPEEYELNGGLRPGSPGAPDASVSPLPPPPGRPPGRPPALTSARGAPGSRARCALRPTRGAAGARAAAPGPLPPGGGPPSGPGGWLPTRPASAPGGRGGPRPRARAAPGRQLRHPRCPRRPRGPVRSLRGTRGHCGLARLCPPPPHPHPAACAFRVCPAHLGRSWARGRHRRASCPHFPTAAFLPLGPFLLLGRARAGIFATFGA